LRDVHKIIRIFKGIQVIYKKIGPALKHSAKGIERSDQIKPRTKLLGL